MEWKDKYNIGVELIDSQHQEMARIIANLKGALETDQKNKVIGDTLRFLVDYTQHHFSAEQDLMRTVNFPFLGNHKTLHQQFIQHVMGILLKVKNKKPLDGKELIAFLIQWLINHIFEEDRKIADYIRHKKAVESPEIKGQPSVKQKLATLKDLLQKQLITRDDYLTKKIDLLDNFISVETIRVKDLDQKFRVLETLEKKELVTNDELLKYKKRLFRKADLKKLLDQIDDMENKLAYLKNLHQNNIISDTILETEKARLLETI